MNAIKVALVLVVAAFEMTTVIGIVLGCPVARTVAGLLKVGE